MTGADMEDREIDIDAFFNEIEKLVVKFDVPPAGFDPLTASDAALRKFGLPARPDPALQPGQFQRWQAMLAPPLYFRPFTFPKFAGIVFPIVSARRGRINNRSRRQRSLNWSGAYLTPRDGTIFNSIYGAWQVPHVQAPTGGTGPVFGSSTWIGFDGQRRYYQSSLPQAGTAQFIASPSGIDHFAWFQWWVRDEEGSGPPFPLMHPAVRPSDFMMVSMHVQPGRQRVKFLLRNASNGEALAFDYDAPQPHRVSGATAEWVMERPSEWVFNWPPTHGRPLPAVQPYELPDYGTALFDRCLAVASHPGGGPDIERVLKPARLIDMYHVARARDRTQKISTARTFPDRWDQFLTVYG